MSKDSLTKFLMGCSNPQLVTNRRTGQSLVSSCGHCPQCMQRKSSRNTVNAIQESAENLYSFFVSLTYNDANIPVLKIVEKRDIFPHTLKKVHSNKFVYSCPIPFTRLYFIDKTRRKLHPKIKQSPYVQSKTYGNCLFIIKDSFKNSLFRKYYKKVHERDSKYFKRKPFKNIPVLCKEDLQKFIKRLRFQIFKTFGVEIRYFACGEYGPKHFRPHYHILLYFNEPKLLAQLQDLVDKCWQYGNTYCEPVRTRNGVASYAAGYLNSTANLPSFYKNKSIAPFVSHSLYFGKLSNDEIFKYVKAFDRYPFEPFTISTSKGIRTISFSSSLKHYLFPKCYDYGRKVARLNSKLFRIFREKNLRESTIEFYKTSEQSRFFATSEFEISDFYKTYSLYNYLYFKYKCSSCYDLARCFLLYESDYHYLLEIPDDLHFEQFELHSKDIDDYHLSILNRCYSSILCSRQVFNNAISTGISFIDYLFKLIDFYNQLEQYNLSIQYLLQQDYTIRYSTDDFSLFYYNFGDELTQRNLEEFLTNNTIFQDMAIDTYVDIQKKVKHKELNDANEIFTNL